jgi:hypothetical protein
MRYGGRGISRAVRGWLALGGFLLVAQGPGLARAAVRSTPPPPSPVSAQVSLGGAGPVIPSSFLGLSVEYNQLAAYEALGPVFDRVISIVHPQPGMVLRLGGRSADRAYWQTSTRGAPRGVFEINPPFLTQLAGLVKRDRFHVMLDLNLAIHSPSSAASFAKAVVGALPASTVTGLSVGNEPDLYNHEPFLDRERVPTTTKSTSRDWTHNYRPLDYRRDFTAYDRALRKALPGIPVGGPEIASANPTWVQSLEGLGSLGPQFLTLHRYASSYCFPTTSVHYPTIPLMLSESASVGLASTARAAIGIGRAHQQPLVVDEANSISCTRRQKLAASFATALWAPDLLLAMVRQGVSAVNWHIRPNLANAPFTIGNDGIVPLPELYGLVLFSQMAPPGAQLVNAKLSAPRGLALKAWTVRVGGRLRTLLINKGVTPTSVTLALNKPGTATVSRLKAPRINAETGVRFANRWIGSDGRWHGRQVTQSITSSNGDYRVAVAPYSAALVTVP